MFLLFPFLVFSQKKEIMQVLQNQKTAWNKADVEGYMQGYWKNDSLVFIGSKGPVYGWKTTLENYKKSYNTPAKMGELNFSDIQIKLLDKNYAFVLGRWKITRENDSPNGIFTLIFQKFGKDWKIISDHTQ
ncbi:MAG: nuclear transport factor 2 family protein [Bacteroidetes bacterium]|jgi:ketosteroid isomerase-like protein|nr:nuclear transport factor 2 family protein [Bacteroidota bacterium]